MALYKNWSSVLIAAGVDFDLECERNLLSLIEMGGDESDDEKISVDAPTANQVECITSPNTVDQLKKNHSPVDVTCLDEAIEQAALELFQ